MHTPPKTLNFYRLFLSYLLVFLIPTTLISFLIFQIAGGILKSEMEKNSLLSTQTAQYNLSQTLESFYITGNAIAYSNFGNSFDLTRENTVATSLISYLGRTALSYIFVDDVFLLYPDGPYVYSSSTSFTKDNFYQYVQSETLDGAQLEELLLRLEKPAMLPGIRLQSPIDGSFTDGYLLYAVPCTRSGYSVGTITFLIPVARLNQFLGNNSPSEYLYLLDSQYRPLNGTPDTITLDPGSFASCFNNNSGELTSIASGGDYTAISGTILPDSLYLLHVSSTEQVFRNLNHFRTATMLFLTGTMFVGLVCVCIAFHRSRLAVNTMTASYEQELQNILPLKQKEVFYSLLEGNYIDSSDFLIQCEESGLDFTANCRYCLLVCAPESVSLASSGQEAPLSSEWETLLASDPDTLPERLLSQAAGRPVTLSYCYCPESGGGQKVFLLGTDAPLPLEEHYFTVSGTELFLSRPSASLRETHVQYAQVRSLLHMRSYSHSQQQADPIYTQRLSYYENCILRINQCLADSDIHGLVRMKQTLISEFERDFIPLDLKIKVLLQLFLLFPSTLELPFGIPEILRISDARQLEQSLTTLFDSHIRAKEKKKESDAPNLSVASIQQFILENYTDPLFSLQLIADHFHVSSSYLSWFFKQKTGGTILDYTTDLKMKLAVSLLAQDLTLQEIALKVGYVNAGSFIRRFKQTMGKTPGEYKKEMQ